MRPTQSTLVPEASPVCTKCHAPERRECQRSSRQLFMKMPIFGIRTLFGIVTMFALLLGIARFSVPDYGATLAIAGGVEPSPGFLATLAQRLEADGYQPTIRPFTILCIDGKWSWFRNPGNSLDYTVGIDFESQDCLVEIWYYRPW
jgi:hypothetical protein